MLEGVDILIVEDSPTQAIELLMFLESYKFRVRLSHNGVDALSLIKERKPQIIISDVVMPEMDGYTLCRKIKEDQDTAQIPVILVTKLSDPRDVMHGLACGADNFILKPYNEKYLLSRIRYLMANAEIRTHERVAVGIEVILEGERHFITAARHQILDLLISTYEQGVRVSAELKAKNDEVERSNRLINGLYNFAAGLTGSKSESEVIAEAMGGIIQFPQVSAACLYMFNEKGEKPTIRTTTSIGNYPLTEQYLTNIDNCACLRSLKSNKSKSATNVFSCTVEGLSPIHVTVPILMGNDLIGLLNVWQQDGQPASADVLMAFTTMSQQMATALARARLFDSLEDLVNERTQDLVTEVQERKRAELALARSESLLRAIVNTMPVGVLVCDKEGVNILHNLEIERIWNGVPTLSNWLNGEFVAKWNHSGEVLQPQHWPAVRALNTNEPVINEILDIQDNEGKWHTVICSALPVISGAEKMDRLMLTFQDITGQVLMDQELRIRNLAIESSVNAIIVTDHQVKDNPIVYVNAAFEEITGYSREEVLGRGFHFLQITESNQDALELIRRATEQPKEVRALLKNHRKDGSVFWNDLRFSPVLNSRNEISHVVGVLHDVTEEKRYCDELERHANFDSLTGLPNRNLLMDRIGQAIAHASRRQGNFILAFLDLDNFKLINEGHGHTIGDSLLRLVATRLLECTSASDTVARLSSDEFVLLLTEMRSLEEGVERLESIRDQFKTAFKIDDAILHVTCSTGFCAYPEDGLNVEALLRHADIALYQAKNDGRNRISAYTAQMNARILRRVKLDHEIRNASQNNELELHYQPQLDLKSGKLCGFEALIRWRKDNELIPPMEFIPLAEELGLISGIDIWVLKNVCQRIVQWKAMGLNPPQVAINLSPHSFLDENLHGVISTIITQSGIDSRALKVELTESVWVRDVDGPMRLMNELRKLGIEISIDDFGTGYSSLSYLHRFQFGQLKIDRAFIHGADQRGQDAALVKAMIGIGHNLGMRVLAEGVETESQLSFLISMGCDEVQGYYYSPPLPAAACETLLREDAHFSLPSNLPQQGDRLLLVVGYESSRHDDIWNVASGMVSRVYYVDTVDDLYRMLASYPIGVVMFQVEFLVNVGAEVLRKSKSLAPLTSRCLHGSTTLVREWKSELINNDITHVMQWPTDAEYFLQQLHEAFSKYELALSNEMLRKLVGRTDLTR